MKITLVSEYFPNSDEAEITGGVETRCYYISKYLSKNNKVNVVTSWRKGLERNQKINGINVIRVGKNHPYSSSGSILSRLLFSKNVTSISKKINSDIIDGYNFLSYLPAHKLAEKINAKKIATYHETWLGDWIKNKGILTGSLGQLWEKKTLSKKWDKIISVSNFTKNKLIENGIEKSLVSTVPSGVELNVYRKIKVKKEKRPAICYAGRLIKSKNIDILIKSIKEVREKIPDIKLKIIGNGKEKKYLEKIKNDMNLNDNIEFLGFIKNHMDVIKEIKKSHIFCLPSSVEGLGLSVIEAMACEVPSVVSDIPALKEITENGKTGSVFNITEKDLSQKIIELLENKQLYNKKKNACKQLSEKYDWKILSKKIEKIYESILNSY